MMLELVEDKMDDEILVQLTGRDAWVIAQQLLIDIGGPEDLSENIDIAYNSIMLALIDGNFVREVDDEAD